MHCEDFLWIYGLPFCILIVNFKEQIFSILKKFNLSFFPIRVSEFCVIRNLCPFQDCKDFSPMFSSGNYIVFIFKYRFGSILNSFCMWYKNQRSNSPKIQLFLYRLLKRLLFPHWATLTYMWVYSGDYILFHWVIHLLLYCRPRLILT